MTNHNPTISSSNATGSFSENANTTGSSAAHALTGTMNFTDSDHSDTHTTSASLKTAVVSGGTTIPSVALTHLNAAMSSVIQTDSYSAGKLKWSFSAADSDFDFLAKNQTLTLTYEIRLNDNHGGTTKKTVTVTVTGTDDKPVIAFGVDAIVNEQANQTLSLSPDTAHLAVSFTDPDLSNTGHTASVVGVTASGATGGILPGFLGQLELMAFFHIDSVVKASGSSTGTINATFSAPDLAFDYLSDGETVDIAYTLRINDQAGGLSTQIVTVTVVGSNDGPTILCGPEVDHLVEGENLSPSGDLTASGEILFGDIDLSDTHTVSSTVSATRSGGGVVPLSEADLLAALSTSVDDSTGHLLGEIDWSFSLDNAAVAFLNSGETLTLTYTLTLEDDAGGTDTQTVTITILGTNDPVVMTSGPQASSLTEFADTTGSSAPNSTSPDPTGSLAFTDTDIGDTHSVAVSVASAAWSGGSSIPSGTSSLLTAALLTTLNDSTGTGSGSVDWTFSIADQALDFLGDGETLTVDYNVAVSDGPTSASQTVTIIATGTNDATSITSGPGSASVEEDPDVAGSTTLHTTAPGTLSFIDADLSNAHDVNVSIESMAWSTGGLVPFATQTDLATALATTFNDSTGSGTGSVDWTFSIVDSDLDFLAAGETLVVTYDVTVSDASTSSTQTVTVTLTGAEDEMIVNPLSASLTDTPFIDNGSIIGVGNLIADAGDSPGDLSNILTITDVNGMPLSGLLDVAGTYGTLFVFAEGLYFYIGNGAIDALQEGETQTEVFNFTVTGAFGESEATTVTFSVHGSNEAPLTTGGIVAGSVTEDLGPSVVVNGSFETGDFTGWSVGPNALVDFFGIGGDYGNYTARLTTTDTFSQAVSTNPSELYTVSFDLAGDDLATFTSFDVFWDGTQIAHIVNAAGGFTHYSFDLLSNASLSTTSLTFSYQDDGFGLLLDRVSVQSAAGVATQTADGNVTFSDLDTADTHTASFIEQGSGYVGTFSLDPVAESSGSGSVDWHFAVDNSDIQFLGAGDSVTQTYTVFVTDDAGAMTQQDVTVTLNGTNDAPTAVGADTVLTNAGEDGAIFIPSWVLTGNDTDPDVGDTLFINDVANFSGASASLFGGVLFFDDSTLDGSFDYRASDGSAVSPYGTVTVDNNSASSTTVTGTGADEILISASAGTALDGGGGNDILIANDGAHDLTGGDGDDLFVIQVVPTPGEPLTVTDFDNVGENDLIAINSGAFSGLFAGQDMTGLFESSADDEFLSPASLLHYNETDQTLFYSFDGTTGSALLLAQFQGSVNLDASDILIV